jgi:hypothetical protein
MDRHLVRHLGELVRKSLHTFHEERRVRKARPFCAPRTTGEGIRARIDGDRESARLGPRAVQDVATVTRTQVHQDVVERGGYCGGLTDVDVNEALAEKSTHPAMVTVGTTQRSAL